MRRVSDVVLAAASPQNQNLRSSGDKILRIEGVLSSFLSYVFNRLSPGPGSKEAPVAFSKACWEAAEQGEGQVSVMMSCRRQLSYGAWIFLWARCRSFAALMRHRLSPPGLLLSSRKGPG